MSRKERERLVVFARIKSGELSRLEGGEVLGLSLRQMHRMYKRFLSQGDAGLVHRSRGSVSPRRVEAGERARALQLCRDVYRGFGPTLAAEKLGENHGIWPVTTRWAGGCVKRACWSGLVGGVVRVGGANVRRDSGRWYRWTAVRTPGLKSAPRSAC